MTTPPTSPSTRTGTAHPGVRPTTVDRLQGLAATVGLLLLVAGIPVVLEMARHRLLPAGFGWDDLGLILTSPVSATLVLILVGAVIWTAWAYLTLTVVLELIAVTGRLRLPRLLGLPRGLARRLVTTASLLFVVSVPPALANTPADAATSHTQTAPHTTTQANADQASTPHTRAHAKRPAGEGAPTPRPAPTVLYTVVEDDSLWSIADQHLGDPMRFTELIDLNRAVLAGEPDFLDPGTVLRLPAPETTDGDREAEPADRPETTAHTVESHEDSGSANYVVRRGDTLSQIALDELGDAHRYPDIVRASSQTVQADGGRLNDPNRIKPGWRLTIPAITPAPSHTNPTATARTDADAAETAAQDAPAPTTDRDHDQTAPGPAISENNPPRDSGPGSPDGEARPGTAALDGSEGTGSDQDRSERRSVGAAPDRVITVNPESSPEAGDPSPGPTPAHQGVRDGVRTPDPPLSIPHTEQSVPHTNPWAPGPATTPDLERTPEPRRTQDGQFTDPAPVDLDQEDSSEIVGPAWLLPGLAGAGAMLAAGLLVAVRRHRAAQWRYRRPGHRITPAPAHTVPVERTIRVTGQAWVGDIDALDRLLRALAGPRLDDPAGVKPALVAVELTGTDAVAHLAEPMDLPLPWVGSGTRWAAPLSTAPAETDDLLAPYPLLVTVGMDADGHTWLLDLEQARTVTVTGDPDSVAAFGRYVAAELLLHPWAENTTVHALATGWQVTGLSTLEHHHDRMDDYDTLACVSEVNEAVRGARQSAAQGPDWYHAVIAAPGIGPTTRSALNSLITNLVDTDRRLGAAAVVLDHVTDHVIGTAPEQAAQPDHAGLVLDVAGGRLHVPRLGWDLAAVGLTDEELAASVAIVDVTRAMTGPVSAAVAPVDEPAPAPGGPASPHSGKRSSPAADDAGLGSAGLVPAQTIPADSAVKESAEEEPAHAGLVLAAPLEARKAEGRPTDPQAPAGPWSLLPAPTAHYVEAAATTTEDVAALAPVAATAPARAVHDTDPDLDRDVAAWFDPDSHRRPRLMLLGPVTATAYGQITEQAARLKALHVETLAYLALHSAGVTGAQLAEDFAIKPGRARSLVTGVRAWLGTDPATRRPYVPDAKQTAAFAATGVPTYQVDGLLVDVDLFQRLHSRARARGADGIDDLITALRLVRGRPFDKTRTRGWTWLFEGDRLDHTMAAMIGDVAHLVCTRAMAEDDIDQARWAAQVGRQANPDDETARLDEITIQYLTGHAELARKRLAEEIYDRTDDEWPPPDPPERTRQITTRRGIMPTPKPRA
ncbi:LysM peptidoglycan-binding domain-containing protein [Promicromonospora sp. NPDC057138]|uniref:LysM peptidoglycan-binding domain-containing protein n=1 Tax=Promicromonospora sp. NPDC057138 TaxID=3346031 RepID=UPI0036421CF1